MYKYAICPFCPLNKFKGGRICFVFTFLDIFLQFAVAMCAMCNMFWSDICIISVQMTLGYL